MGDTKMPVRSASAVWNGTLKEGNGQMALGSGALEVPFSFSTRFGDEPGTNPEELIGAAQAGCFSMFLSALLSGDGHSPKAIRTSARVHLGDGPTVTLIELETEADVPGLEEDTFQGYVEKSKTDCPISKALSGPELRVSARLKG